MWGLCKRYGLCLWCPAPAGSPPQCLPSGPQVTSRVTEAAEALAALRAKANADLAELREARDSADQSVGRLAEAQRAAVADLNDRISRCVPPPLRAALAASLFLKQRFGLCACQRPNSPSGTTGIGTGTFDGGPGRFLF